MNLHSVEYKHILSTIIQELLDDPIDLLSNGDGHGESAYLENARCSYFRTVSDVLILCDKLGGNRKNFRILEIGSFLGVVSCTLAQLGFSVSALDIPEFMKNEKLKNRYVKHGVEVISANLQDNFLLAEFEKSFSIVIMCETLEHLNFNPIPAVCAINRCLTTDGFLYISLPNQASLVNRVKLLFGHSIHNPINDYCAQLGEASNMIVGIHWREYTTDELNELLTLGGFIIISHDLFTMHQASLPARILYAIFPRLRSNQTVVARKMREPLTDLIIREAR